MSVTGQCLCGDIKYTIDNPPEVTGVCHCKNCQRQAGSAFSTLASVPKGDFHLVSGEPALYQDSDTDSGNSKQNWVTLDEGVPVVGQQA